MLRRTIKEAAAMIGVTVSDRGLDIHFNCIINWYVLTGIICPICYAEISWVWNNPLPSYTRAQDMVRLFNEGLKPESEAADVLRYGHRWVHLKCKKCGTEINVNNFDVPPEG